MSITLADVKAAVSQRLKVFGWIDGALLIAVAVFAMVQLGRGETVGAALGLVTFVYIAEMVVWKTEARKWQARYEEATQSKPAVEQDCSTTINITSADSGDAIRQAQKLADLRSLTHHGR